MWFRPIQRDLRLKQNADSDKGCYSDKPFNNSENAEPIV